MLRRTTSRVALTALAISALVVAVKAGLDSRPEPSQAFAQPGVPCGTDPSCGNVTEPAFPGDANCDGVIDNLDIPVLASLVFDCNLCPDCNLLNGDANCDGFISAADLEALSIPCQLITPTPGPSDCCACDPPVCSAPLANKCPLGCDVTFDSACVVDEGCVSNTPTPTTTPPLGDNDCCQCPDDVCAVPSNEMCPTGCAPQRDSACTDAGLCVANTPTPTITPTLGPNDCCQCAGNVCAVPTDAACPTGCTPQFDSACTDAGLCVANTPTPTLTPTLGPNDCCQCGVDTCTVPDGNMCPEGCDPERDSACDASGDCVANTPTATLTPTPTVTPTLGPNDCCQCAGVICAVPTDAACPENCNPVFDAACVEGIGCVQNTVTPTPEPTLGPNDCCVCGEDTCSVPMDAACPTGCTPQFDSACTSGGRCVTNTPTPTLTPTLGPNDCCQCEGEVCAVPGDGTCPSGCTPQRDSACAASGLCITNTPTLTPTVTPPLTPTLGPNDCCQCGEDVCAVPADGTCPEGCAPQRDSACAASGECVPNTPTTTPTAASAATRTRTKTMTPLVIPFPC